MTETPLHDQDDRSIDPLGSDDRSPEIPLLNPDDQGESVGFLIVTPLLPPDDVPSAACEPAAGTTDEQSRLLRQLVDDLREHHRESAYEQRQLLREIAARLSEALRPVPCAPADLLSEEQRRVLHEHARLTKALGTIGSAQPVKSVAPCEPQDWGGFFSPENDLYARLQYSLFDLLGPPPKAN